MQQQRGLEAIVQERLSASFREKAQTPGSPSECLWPQEQRQQFEQPRPPLLTSNEISSPRLLLLLLL